MLLETHLRRWAALLFSILLVWTQAFAGHAMPGIKLAPTCVCCDCRGSSCCIDGAPPVSQPFSTAIAPQVTQSTYFLPLTVLQASPAWRVIEPICAASIHPPLLSVPLFQQTCALLI